MGSSRIAYGPLAECSPPTDPAVVVHAEFHRMGRVDIRRSRRPARVEPVRILHLDPCWSRSLCLALLLDSVLPPVHAGARTALLIVGAVAGGYYFRDFLQRTGLGRPQRISEWVPIGLAVGLLLSCLILPPAFNLSDDSTGYAVFPIKIRDLGGIGPDPFSARRSFLLGGSLPIQAMVLSFLPISHLNISEPALGIGLAVLLLTILSARTPGASIKVSIGVLLLGIFVFSGSNVLSNMAPAFLMAPLIFLLVSAAMRTEPVFASTSRYGFALGVTAGYLICLRTSAAPLTCVLLPLGIFYDARRRGPGWKMQFVKGTAAALLGGMLLVLPFSLDLYQSSGEYLPHRVPKNNWVTPGRMPISDYLQTLAGLPAEDPLLIVTVCAFLFWAIFNRARRETVKRAGIVFVGLLLNYALLAYGSRGIQTSRYFAPLSLGFLLYLLSSDPAGGFGRLRVPALRFRPALW